MYHDPTRMTRASPEEPEEVDQKCSIELPILPCWDETDDGVIPICRGEPKWWKVFNQENPYTNDNILMIAFGNVGFHHFDMHRKFYMGAAMWSTLGSIFFTIAGCFALSEEKSVVHNVHWTWIRGQNMTSGEAFKVEIGLRSLNYYYEPCNPFECQFASFPLDQIKGWPNTYLEDSLSNCRGTTDLEFQFGAFVTCVTLIFALIGCINRMRFHSDANIQKALGMVSVLISRRIFTPAFC